MSPTPKAVRVKTSDGWQDIAMQGPQGPPGLTLAASLAFGATFTGAETTGQASEISDVGGIGVVSGTDYQITRSGTYIIIPTMESINMNVNTSAAAILRRNPAGANEWLTAVYPSAALQSAGAQRLLAGLPIIKDLAAGDILRGRVSHSETGVNRTVNLYLALFMVGSASAVPLTFNDIYCETTLGYTSLGAIALNGIWSLMPIPAPPKLVITKADGVNDDFTRNADGSITINRAGNYHISANINSAEQLGDGTSFNWGIAKKAGVTPAAGDTWIAADNQISGAAGNNYPAGTCAGTVYCATNDRIAIFLWHNSGATRTINMVTFSIVRTGAGPQGPAGAGPVQLAYSEYTTQITVTATAEPGTDIVSTPAAIFDGSPVWIEVFLPYIEVGSGNICWPVLIMDTTVVGRLGLVNNIGTTPIYVNGNSYRRRVIPSAGSHTFKIGAFKNGANTVNIGAGVGGPSVYVPGYIRITKE